MRSRPNVAYICSARNRRARERFALSEENIRLPRQQHTTRTKRYIHRYSFRHPTHRYWYGYESLSLSFTAQIDTVGRRRNAYIVASSKFLPLGSTGTSEAAGRCLDSLAAAGDTLRAVDAAASSSNEDGIADRTRSCCQAYYGDDSEPAAAANSTCCGCGGGAFSPRCVEGW